jgi:hypothetical protein
MDKEKKVNNKKQIKILKYEEHPEFVGNEIEVAIMNNKKRKPTMKNPTVPKKPKQPRMTINQLAIEMRAGFARVNIEIAAINQRMDKLEDKVENISDVLIRNNLK